MNLPAFQVFRLNFTDRAGLFENPLADNTQFLRVLIEATNTRCDLVNRRRRSGFRWSLRAVHSGLSDEHPPTHFASATFSKELLYREGRVVTDKGLMSAMSQSNPPLAEGTLVFFDIDRHLVGIQESFPIMKGSNSWIGQLELILSAAAAWSGFTSGISLDPIAPRPYVESEMRRFQTVNRIRLTLKIPNPQLSEVYRRLYEEMLRGGVRELTEDLRSERGLNLQGDTLPAASFEMALNGYRKGAIWVDGVVDGKQHQLKVDSEVARIEINEVKAYAEGVRDGVDTPKAKRAAALIIQKLSSVLGDVEEGRANDNRGEVAGISSRTAHRDID
jgi:hypothetical protein